MSTTTYLILIGYLLASYISVLHQWRKLQKKLQTDAKYMPVKFIIDSVTSKIDFFKSWEWKFFMGIGFLFLAPFIFASNIIGVVKKLLKGKK